MAESMTFARATRSGSLAISPLDQRRLRARGGPTLAGSISILPRLADAMERNQLPTLEELSTLDRTAFEAGDRAELLYALSALWVHYLGTADPLSQDAFKTYLQGLANSSQSQFSSRSALLGDQPEVMESRFRAWLRGLAEELAPLYR